MKRNKDRRWIDQRREKITRYISQAPLSSADNDIFKENSIDEVSRSSGEQRKNFFKMLQCHSVEMRSVVQSEEEWQEEKSLLGNNATNID